VGDLALIGRPVVGEIVATRGGHALHSRFVDAVLRSAALEDEPAGLLVGEAIGSFA
jgi:UDP-3-O-acyl-N-acetylglucosamine deacetylase